MMQRATTVAVLCMLASQAEAFAPPSLPQHSKTSLNLLPSQGNQLVAAYNAACVEKERTKGAADEAPAADINIVKSVGAIAASKNFLARVFHMPSVKHPGKQDVVYYPMIGFRFFEGIDTVFPTTCHASCMMPTKGQQEEEVYGWYSSSCKLDLFSEDVCHNPIGSEEDESLQ